MLHKHTFAHVSKIIQFTFIAHVFYSAVKNVKSQPCLAYSFVWLRFSPRNKGKNRSLACFRCKQNCNLDDRSRR